MKHHNQILELSKYKICSNRGRIQREREIITSSSCSTSFKISKFFSGKRPKGFHSPKKKRGNLQNSKIQIRENKEPTNFTHYRCTIANSPQTRAQKPKKVTWSVTPCSWSCSGAPVPYSSSIQFTENSSFSRPQPHSPAPAWSCEMAFPFEIPQRGGSRSPTTRWSNWHGSGVGSLHRRDLAGAQTKQIWTSEYIIGEQIKGRIWREEEEEEEEEEEHDRIGERRKSLSRRDQTRNGVSQSEKKSHVTLSIKRNKKPPKRINDW